MIDLLSRLVADGQLDEETAGLLLAQYDGGRLDAAFVAGLPLSPGEAVRGVDGERTATALALLLLLLFGGKPPALPLSGRIPGVAVGSLTFAHAGTATLIQRLYGLTARQLAGELAAGALTVRQWQAALGGLLEETLTQQMMLAHGTGALTPAQLQRLDSALRVQQAYLSRFADDVQLRQMAGAPMSEAQLGMRSELYGGASRGLFFEEAELEALALAGDGYVIEYVARDDGNTCLLPNQRVRTQRGWVPVSCLVTGDEVETHDGTFARLVAVHVLEGKQAVRIRAGGFSLEATSDHPVLIERQGRLQWCEAGAVRLGDSVLVKKGSKPLAPRIIHHRSFRQTDDGKAKPLGAFALGGIAALDAFCRVPVRPICFQQKIQRRQVEVKHILADSILAFKRDFGRGENLTHFGFQAALLLRAAVVAIASKRTENATFCRRTRDDTKRFAALLARSHQRRAAAFLRTVVSRLAALPGKHFATSFTRNVDRTLASAGNRTGVIAGSSRGRYGELLAADSAGFCHPVRGVLAVHRTVHAIRAALWDTKHLATERTRLWGGTCRVVCPPKFRGARAAAKLRARSLLASRYSHALAAIDTDIGVCHDLIVPESVISGNVLHAVAGVERISYRGAVYDLMLDRNHTFYAEGIVVHNCGPCYRAQGFYLPGTRHPLPGRDCLGKNRCRCTLRFVLDPVMAAQLRGRP